MNKFARLLYKHWQLLAMAMVIVASSTTAYADTSLYMNSDPGDYIGVGQTYFFTPADGTFTALKNYNQGVSLSFTSPDGFTQWWHLDFASADNSPLTVGTYTGAVRYPFQNGVPGLSIYGDGRGCNTLTGSFNVLEVSYGANSTINSFDATFEQHCEGGTTAIRGEIKYNASTNITLNSPSHLSGITDQNIHFVVSATDTQSEPVSLSASGLPAGATFVDNGDNTGTFDWTPTSNQGGNYFVTFQGNDQLGNTGGSYTSIAITPPPAPNDEIDNAVVLPYMPYATSETVDNATTASDDPYSCAPRYQSVWYAFTPQNDIRIEGNTFGSNYDTTLAVYTGTRGHLTEVTCNDDSQGLTSRVRFDGKAGTTYYFMVGSFSPRTSTNLVFNLQEAPPPLTITPTVYQFGTVTPSTGAVTISGSVKCSKPAYIYINGSIKQVRAGVPVNGQFYTSVSCNGTTDWTATVIPQSALFKGRAAALFTGGKANVSGSAHAYDPDEGQSITRPIQTDIILRGKE